MLVAALIGFAFGFIGSIPVAGPIAALVLQRGLTGRYRSGLFIGLGCALAEAGYAFLAFWGFATFLADYPMVEPASRVLAALILFGLGVTFARYKGPIATEERPVESPLKSFGVGFTITALNPTLIATWTAATVTLSSTGLLTMEPLHALPFATGTLTGIGGWFVLFIALMKRYGSRFSRSTLDKTVRAVGWFILALSLFFAWRFVDYLRG